MKKNSLLIFLFMMFGYYAVSLGGTGDYIQEGGGYLGTASTRNAEDTLTNGSNLPDGAAVKAYGDANWTDSAFSGITSGTNTTANMVVGPGAAMSFAGGTINASHYKGISNPTAGDFDNLSGTDSNLQDQISELASDSLKWSGTAVGLVAANGRTSLELGTASTRNAEDTLTNGSNLPDGAAVKAYGDANWTDSAFSGITSGTNTTANMVVGPGAALSAAGGSIGATHYKGSEVPTAVEFGYLQGATSLIQNQLNAITGGLGTASSRDAEDTLTNGSNLPDGAAVKAYGDANWGGGSGMVYPGAGIALSTGSAWGTSITNNSGNWNTAYSDRLKWDGGSAGLTAATGRTSLGLGTASTRNAEDTLTNGSNLPDGAAIKAYGDTNWGGGGSGYWTQTGTDVHYDGGLVYVKGEPTDNFPYLAGSFPANLFAIADGNSSSPTTSKYCTLGVKKVSHGLQNTPNADSDWDTCGLFDLTMESSSTAYAAALTGHVNVNTTLSSGVEAHYVGVSGRVFVEADTAAGASQSVFGGWFLCSGNDNVDIAGMFGLETNVIPPTGTSNSKSLYQNAPFYCGVNSAMQDTEIPGDCAFQAYGDSTGAGTAGDQPASAWYSGFVVYTNALVPEAGGTAAEGLWLRGANAVNLAATGIKYEGYHTVGINFVSSTCVTGLNFDGASFTNNAAIQMGAGNAIWFGNKQLWRSGDDLYWGTTKLN